MFVQRKSVFGLMLAACMAGGLAADAAPPVTLDALSKRNVFLVVYRRGPAWEDGKGIGKQAGMEAHFAYYLQLHRKGLLVGAGGFSDESGGAAAFEASDKAAAAKIIASDPAVKSGTLRFELHRWQPVPWEDVSTSDAMQQEG